MIGIKFKSDKLVKVTFYNGLATVVRMISSLATNKIMAVLIGVKGFVLIGQLGNLYSVALTFLSGIGIATTKYISQYKKSESKTKQYIDTIFTLYVFYALCVSIMLLVFAPSISKYFLKSNDYSGIIIAFALTFMGGALNNFFLSAINGFQDHKKFVIINIVNSVITLLFTITLIFFLGIYGALLANVTYQSVCLFATYFVLRKNEFLRFKNLKIEINSFVLKKILIFSLMPLFSGLTFPIIQLIVRERIINTLGIASAGYWEAINRVSNMEILIITTSLSVYFLPKLSELKKENDIRDEIRKALSKIIPPLILLTCVLILIKDYLTILLFAKSFSPMNDLYLFQFSGNVFKVAGWIIAYRMLAKSMIKDYIITELIYFSVYTILSFVFLNLYGIKGAVLSYLISYIIYFVYLALRFRFIKNFFNNSNGKF